MASGSWWRLPWPWLVHCNLIQQQLSSLVKKQLVTAWSRNSLWQGDCIVTWSSSSCPAWSRNSPLLPSIEGTDTTVVMSWQNPSKYITLVFNCHSLSDYLNIILNASTFIGWDINIKTKVFFKNSYININIYGIVSLSSFTFKNVVYVDSIQILLSINAAKITHQLKRDDAMLTSI